MENDYITPNKTNPVYIAHCSDFGTIQTGQYKDYVINNSCGDTFALSYIDAVNFLLCWVAEWKNEYTPNTKFTLFSVDGTVNKFGEVNYKKVYQVTLKQAIS